MQKDPDLPEMTPEQIVKEMDLSGSLARRLDFVGFTQEDAVRVRLLKPLLEDHVQALTATFFDFLSRLPEAGPLLSNSKLLAEARLLKAAHLRAMVSGTYDADYVQQRLRLALIYAKVKLDPRVFLGAFHNLLKNLGTLVMKHYQAAPLEGFEDFMSLKKVAFFDIGIIIDVLVFERERIILKQQQDILELSIPVLQLREQVLLLPLVGTVGPQRAQQIGDNLFRAIRSRRPRIAIVDLSGVARMDAMIMGHVLKATDSAARVGTESIITGLAESVARSLIAGDMVLGATRLKATLLEGIELAEALIAREGVENA